MAIYDINTIQGDVNTSYGDEYIKQALANLGQRQGLKGDSIHTQSFKITDAIFDETNKIIPTTYIKGYYDAKNDEIIYTADNDDLSTPLFTYRLSETISDVEINNLYLLSAENVNLAPKYVECKIVKKQSADSYYFIGKGIQDNEISNIVVLEFSESGVNLIDGLYFENVESDTGVMLRYSTSTQTTYSSELLLSDIYNTILNYDSIDDIVKFYVNNIVLVDTNPNNDSSTIVEEENDNVLTVFKYLSSVLIPEIKSTYNDRIYKVNGNEYLGLKRRILYELIKYTYNEFNKIDDKTDTGISVYFDKDFYISYISNTNTDVIYISYDITFRGRGINNAKVEPTFDYKNEANLFLADILTEEDRYASYKFYVQYIDGDKYVDSIYIEQTSILPYIGKDDSLSDVWYINGEQTNVHATGADAGNPNIMFVSYTLNESSSKDESVIDIDVLHTYTDDNVTLEKINNAFDKEAVMQTFYYDLGNTVNVANSIDKNYEFTIPLPDPNKLIKNAGFENFIKNVLIFAIVDVKISSTIIDNDTLHSLISGNGPSSYITVFFHSSKNEEGKYIWTPILNPLYNSETPIVSSSSMAPVLDLSSMTSLRQLMNYYVQVAFKPDVYYHRWVVFTSTNEVLKNTGKNINSDAKYPVFKVDTGEEYYGTSSFNTLNFTPKFVLEKNVIEDNGRINAINDVSKDNASFTIDANGTISAVTPVIKINAENSDTAVDSATEFIPNAKVDQNLEINDSYPMLDLREVFVNNQTLLNRLSIVTTSNKVEDGRYPIYHAYIGHRYSDAEAVNSLVIGTSNEVYNMQNSYTMAREVDGTPGWRNFKEFDNLTIALPLFAELDATFDGKNISINNNESIFSVVSKRISFENSNDDASFTLKNPTIDILSNDNNKLSIIGNTASILSNSFMLNDSDGTYSIMGSSGNIDITAENDITTTAKNSIRQSISNSGQYVEISHDNVTISDQNNPNSSVAVKSNVVTIDSTNNIKLTNTIDNANKQSIVLDKNKIELSFNDTKTSLSNNTITTNAQTIEVTAPTEIKFAKGDTSKITGGNNSNVIEYRPDELYISGDDKLTLNGTGGVDISGNGPLTVSNTSTTFDKDVTIDGSIEAKGNVDLGSESSTLKFSAATTEFNTGTTSFSADLSVAGNVTATNVTVNGLLVTKTSSVTGILTWSDPNNHWEYEYPYWEDENLNNLIDKEFLFGFTTIDLSYVFNGGFTASNFITDTKKYVNGACTYNEDGDGTPKSNTRNFLRNDQNEDNPYVYSTLSLNLTSFLNKYSTDSMFVRGNYIRPNFGEGAVITKVDDVIIPLANPALYNLPSTIDETYWKENNKHRLKTFMLFIERFTFWDDPEHSFSTGDVYALRGAKEVSMTMDNFNPDMINHIYENVNPIFENYLTITALEDGLTASLSTNSCEYCVDGDGNWKILPAGTVTESINSGQTLSFRANIIPVAGKGIGRFTISKQCNLTGNCMSMLFRDDAVSNYSLSGKNYAFYQLFINCTNILNVSKKFLPATTLSDACYREMFYGCTSLTTAPKLPATMLTNECYHSMFYRCRSLTAAPTKLPATALAEYCYDSMFDTCTSLTTAPELPATTLADYCYRYMFHNCTSLTTAPELPATTLADNCYYSMFSGCTSLTTAPELPATILANSCYMYMFENCTSMATTPALPATTLTNNCYNCMFSGCGGIRTAPALPATALANNCYFSMFSGCTRLATAPTLPATTLAKYCYYSMFKGCSTLKTAPELPATTLTDYCYGYMFNGCSSLNYIKMLATDISADGYCLDKWVVGVSYQGKFVKNSATSLSSGTSGIPSGWTVEDAA